MTKKWTAAEALEISKGVTGSKKLLRPGEVDTALYSGYDDTFEKHMIVAPDQSKTPEGFSGTVFSTHDEMVEALDTKLNEVYEAARATLPAPRFAALKQEQRAWLAERDRATTAEEKSKRVVARIRQLQELLWLN